MRLSTGLALSAAAATVASTLTTTIVVSAYTFDPLNNMWKPSGAKNAARRSSSFASSYAPRPSEAEAPQVFEEEVVRAQYSTWAGHYHNGVDGEHGESFQQKSLVQIEYNKRTGEVSLVDHDGIITKEDYQNLMRAISTGNANDAERLVNFVEGATTGLDVVDEDVTLGATHLVDGEDIDPNDVIDTAGEEVRATVTVEAASDDAVPQPNHATEFRHQANSERQHHHHQEQQQHQADTFTTYQIPQPPTEIQAQLQEQQYHQLQQIQQRQYQHQEHSMMAYHQPQLRAQGPPARATAVAEPVPETTPQNGGWGFNDRRTTFIN